MDKVDTIIIGAGVIGMAIARALALAGREVLVLEAEAAIGQITTARNSGVIHAGIYYQPGSLKARLCVAGAKQLYAYAGERGILHKRCGKLIVATDQAQIAGLHQLRANAEQNGVAHLAILTGEQARQLEPELTCAAALHSPDSGLIDIHPYMLALQGDAESAGAMLALNAPVIDGEITLDGFVLSVGGAAPMTVACRGLINAAGLGAQAVARSLRGLAAATIPPQVLAKGNYFSMSGKPPFKMLIYPLPVPGSSGLHATCDFGNRMRFGPDVEWVDEIDYRVDPERRFTFEQSIRQYWPALPDHALQPDYSGIRPKLGHGSPHNSDFMIQTEHTHGIVNLINLYGIESPGLTASLAIAEEVANCCRN